MLNPYESPGAAPDHPPAHNPANRAVLAWFAGTVAAAVIGLTAAIGYQLQWVSLVAVVLLPVVAGRLFGVRRISFLTRMATYAGIGWCLCLLLQPTYSSRRRPTTSPWVYVACHGVAALMTGVGVAFEYREQRLKQDQSPPA